ncbi:MAG: hypothetical protein RIS94_904 [Pseudomonadota bacterium]|jgi:flagellar protein FlgJ
MTPVSALSATAAPLAPERAKLREAAQAFEAIFVRQMLASARAADFGGKAMLGDDQGDQTFTQMRDERFAQIASESGAFGLARQIEAQLARMIPASAPTAKEG